LDMIQILYPNLILYVKKVAKKVATNYDQWYLQAMVNQFWQRKILSNYPLVLILDHARSLNLLDA
jgi:hypothetical protein